MEVGVCGWIVQTIVEVEQIQAGGSWDLLTRGHTIGKNQHLRTATAEPPANKQRSGTLGGGVQVLKRVPWDKLAILSDLDYLISGAQGQVHSWRETSWIGKGGGVISSILIWEDLLLEIERRGRILKWVYVPGHAGLEENDTAHRLAVEGMCLSTVWALPRTTLSRLIDDTQVTHEQSLCPVATPPSDNIYAVQDTTVIGGEDSTNSSPDDHPRAIWLSLGLVEPEEEAS